MPLLREVRRSDTDSDVVHRYYDRLFGQGTDPVENPGTATGSPGNHATVMALVPDVLEACTGLMVTGQSPERRLSPRLAELGRLRAGWTIESKFVWSQHCKHARDVGLTEEQIEAVKHWQVADCFSASERAYLAFADGLLLQRGRVAPGIAQAMKTHASDEEIYEFTFVTLTYGMFASMSRALRFEFDDVDDRITEVPAPEGFDPAYVMAPPRSSSS